MLRSRKRASSNPVRAFPPHANVHFRRALNGRHAQTADIQMQAPKTPPSASASLAATKAFIRDRESNGALSSAAAAAALRTHTTTPTPVGETVTKRMVRKGSVSSQGSGSQQQQPGLRRHSSSGSMTERSFRAPSPSRSSPIDHNAPPVPAVPKNVPAASVVHRRNSSLEPPARGGSPAARGGGRGVSLDRGTAPNASQVGRGQPRAPNLSRVVEDEPAAGQRSSINFSRPMSPQQTPPPTSKPPASARGGQSGWFGGPVVNPEQTFRGAKPQPKTFDDLGAYAMQNTHQAVQNAADRPVSTKTAHMSTGVQGARLAAGSMRAKPSGTAVQVQPTYAAASDRPRIVDPNSPFAVYDPSSRKFIHKQDAMNLHRAMSDAEDPAPPYEAQQEMTQTHHEAPRYTQPARQPVQHQHVVQRVPSISPERGPSKKVAFISHSEATIAPTTRNDRPGVVHSHDANPESFTAQEFTEAEDRLPADANTSRKLETSAPEKLDDGPSHEDSASPKFVANQDSPYPHLAPVFAPTLSGPPSMQGSTRSDRTHSMSPPRNAHFAAVAVEFPNGIRHQPPGRSVSPAKSALKASPSVSRRSHSPLANDGRAISRGDASETSEAVLDDGGKKKKKVRISFEEEPTVVGTSAYADTDVPNTFAGPSASKWDNVDEEEDPDEFMKPRPVLPSFGSIRDKNRRPTDEDVPEKVTETVSSSLSNSTTLPAESTEVSSDHKIGGILAQDFATKKTVQPSSTDPLPPEVTTVEGSGYYSDSDSSDASSRGPVTHAPEVTVQKPAAQITPEPEPKTLTNPVETRPAANEIPAIAVQPASPYLPEDHVVELVPKAPRPFVPGGWDDDDDDASEPETQVKQPTVAASALNPPSITIEIPVRPVEDDSSDDNSSVYSDAYEDLEDGEGFGSIDAIMESPISSSRYVSNPTTAPAETRSHVTGLESSKWAPGNAQPVKATTQSGRGIESKDRQYKQQNADWDAAEQYRSEAKDLRKQQTQGGLLIDRLATKEEPKAPGKASIAVARTEQKQERGAQVESTPKPSKQDQSRRVEPATKAQRQVPPPQSARSPAQPRKSAMKKPATGSPQVAATAEIPLRKTMRDRTPITTTAEPQMRKTMRGADAALAGRGSPGLAGSRQSMPLMDTKSPRGALQKKHLPAAAAATSAAKPRPQSTSGVPSRAQAFTPAPTYDSDSDASISSFQRERQRSRKARNNTGAYTMRSSMRSGPTPTMRAPPPVRSISPPPTTSPPPSTLRKSMRPTSPTPESPGGVKSSRFSIRSLSPAGRFRRRSTADSIPPVPPVQAPPPKKATNKKSMFGKSSDSKPPPARASRPNFKSRITDSSDEESDRPRRFQSRFADSDSEDEDFELPQGLAPVRGIPKRPGEEDGDSTDLEDETSDAEPSSAPVTNGNSTGKTPATNGSTHLQGTSLASGSLRKQGAELPSFDAGKKSKPKRGFFGLGRKKNSYLADAEADARDAPSSDIPMPPEQRNRDLNRPLTPIGEDRDLDTGETIKHPPKSRAFSPPLERAVSDSWPLPQPPSLREAQRPQSADGPMQRKSNRPILVKRNPSQISQAHTEVDPKSGKEVSFGRTGKKKKFQGLRRVLGLND
ncbi:hypothetical protein N0V90_007095 [Kalmusia sp. IMI 367209]|nr:hypothetical protein N0V90_007095 [Kalmusia sp. IMI 367209]